MGLFELSAPFEPAGDQPQAIEKLWKGLRQGEQRQTLLGVTGSGKTFTMAHLIAKAQKPTLVIAHNKTLAAQLVQEFRAFFPRNAVEYFVSYYDYYQPEAYVVQTDTYIEKETQINEEIDRLRHSTTTSLLSRRDVIVVASVSCIYGLGSPELYRESLLEIRQGEEQDMHGLIKHLARFHYTRAEVLERGRFRVRGEVLEVMPPSRETVYRIVLAGRRKVRELKEYNPSTGEILAEHESLFLPPAKHFLLSQERQEQALAAIEEELEERLRELRKEGKLLEAQRLEMRTRQDLAMIREIGYCSGIENYSRHLSGRSPGEPPETLLDYFPKDFLLFIDESHVTVPQIQGMYHGDRARKENLVRYGFRLPSALDNRPLTFHEFEERMPQTIFVSATPGPYERKVSSRIVEQIIRPTGLLDPEVIVRPIAGQVQDLLREIQRVVKRKERVLVTTLTKKQAEDLTEYLEDRAIKAKYLHSDVDTLERVEILEDLRAGKFDVLVGVNLLREGLDLPEVSLVAILDADKEGFLRSETSLIQTMGRAARHKSGRVLLYADVITGALKSALEETRRRRAKQEAYNRKHGITPESAKRFGKGVLAPRHKEEPISEEKRIFHNSREVRQHIAMLEKKMKQAVKDLAFEEAALLRDEIRELSRLLEEGKN